MKTRKLNTFMFVFVLVAMMVAAVGCAPAAPAAPAEPAAEEPAAEEAAVEEAPAEAEEAVEEEVVEEEAAEEVEQPYAGVELTFACMTDQYIEGFKVLIPQFEEETGIVITLDELGYTDLYQKLTADFVGQTASYDLMTMDIVWSGEYGANGYTLPLDDLMERDSADLPLDDVLPVMWTQGSYNGQQWAFPLGGYANVLNYRKDVFEEAGIEPPTTQEELLEAAMALNDPDNDFYGIALLGAGSAGAQDYMSFLQQHGYSVLDADGNVVLNSPEHVETLEFFGELFKYAPPGSSDYWWDQRETAFRSGMVAMMEGWSIARPDYEDAEMSDVVGKVDITYAPISEGMDPTYGFGGWGIGINASSDSVQQEAAWEFIKWFIQPENQKTYVLNRGVPILRQTMTDEEIVAELPWMPMLLDSFENGDGDYRPRIPQYTIIESALGTYVSAFLVGEMSAQEALDAAQAQVEQNWQ